MLVSYKWLQEYFDEKLINPKDLVEKLTKSAFEVEGIKEINGDTVIDLDVLPNRAHDCLSHDGIAKEISIVFDIPMKERKEFDVSSLNPVPATQKIRMETKDCPRYMACEIDNVDIKDSPKEIKDKLEVLGQRSISNIVDITNIVLNETGQPMHAFDKDKLDGDIVVRQAIEGEKMMTLDGKDITLDETITVIADEKAVLAIAGVKGGIKAEVDGNTRNIVLESANFLPGSNRKTAQKVNIRTDASKRYENEIHPNQTEAGIVRAIELIKEYASKDETIFHEVIDEYPNPRKPYYLGVSKEEINSLLGLELNNSEIESIFDRMEISWNIVNPTEKVLEVVKNAEGKPYKYGASVTNDSPDAFDCSSLTSYAYAQGGISIPRMVVDQFVYGDDIKKEDILPGDLVFSNTGILKRKIDFESVEYLKGTKVEHGVDHVGVYLGDGRVIHCTEHNDSGVITENISDSERFGDLVVGYKRMTTSDSDRYVLEIPDQRLDLRIKEEIIEEVGRLYGYDNIEEKSLDDISFDVSVNKEHVVGQIIRKTLVESGFSEIITYVFRDKGDIEMMKPFAEDKAFLRTNMKDGMDKAIELNENNMDLVGIDDLLMFEIGNTFTISDGEIIEKPYLSIGVKKGKGRKKPRASVILSEVLKKLSDELDVEIKENISDNHEVVEIPLDEIYKKAKIENYINLPEAGEINFKTISQYPVMLRDISVWVPGGSNNEEMIVNLVSDNAGELLVRTKLFDVWTKEEEGVERTSYAFRLVFQSQERTLSDEEINTVMDKITEVLNNKDGWEVR